VVDLAIIKPGSYSAEGSYGFTETGLRLPFHASFSVELFPDHLTIEGRGRQHSGRPDYPFRCSVERDPHSQSQAEVSVTVASIAPLTGRVSLTGPTLEMLAYDLASNSVMSARVVPLDKPRLYELSGFLSLHGLGWFPFHFRVVPTETQEALANVVGISSRRGK
jgi:hypothetical protein